VGRLCTDCLLVDVGSTTTDIIPIQGGAPMARGRTDIERLQTGELVYSGALRTPVEAIAPTVPVRGRPTGVSAEGFALAGDVHVWRGELAPADYSVATPDGRPTTKEFAGERLARVVCADREMLDETDIGVIADALWDAQVTRIGQGLERVRARQPALARVVVTGLGEFLGAAAVREMFKRVKIGDDAAHWMAVLGMDQFAHALAARLPEAALVDGDGGIAAALQATRLPVLAPYRWLRAADPLPHSWEVTSDSIAAWLAGQLRARRIVLLKPAHAGPKKLVDAYFLRTLPHGVEHLIVTADDLGQLDVA